MQILNAFVTYIALPRRLQNIAISWYVMQQEVTILKKSSNVINLIKEQSSLSINKLNFLRFCSK